MTAAKIVIYLNRMKMIGNGVGGSAPFKPFRKLVSRVLVVPCLVTSFSFATASPDTAAGENIFKSHCILCHGADATGNTALGKQLKARNLHSAFVQKQSDAELKSVITQGKGNMPSFAAQLTSAQIDEVFAYIRHLGKSRK